MDTIKTFFTGLVNPSDSVMISKITNISVTNTQFNITLKHTNSSTKILSIPFDDPNCLNLRKQLFIGLSCRIKYKSNNNIIEIMPLKNLPETFTTTIVNVIGIFMITDTYDPLDNNIYCRENPQQYINNKVRITGKNIDIGLFEVSNIEILEFVQPIVKSFSICPNQVIATKLVFDNFNATYGGFNFLSSGKDYFIQSDNKNYSTILKNIQTNTPYFCELDVDKIINIYSVTSYKQSKNTVDFCKEVIELDEKYNLLVLADHKFPAHIFKIDKTLSKDYTNQPVRISYYEDLEIKHNIVSDITLTKS